MSKLGCICGHVIRDQTDDIPYKARFIRDQDYEGFFAYAGDIAAFIAAIQADQRSQWIKQYFSDSYPTDIPNASILNDILVNYKVEFEGDLYQCENCGRVKIQVQDKNLFASFAPEDENFSNLFKRFKE
jgi:hypothetical protein